MSDDSNLRRWGHDDVDIPTDLARLMRVGRADVGSRDEVAELARRLSAVLGPVAGLGGGADGVPEPDATGPDHQPPASGPRPSADVASGVARVGSKLSSSAARWAAWAIGGTGAIAGLWWVAADRASVPREPTPALDARPAAVVERAAESPLAQPPASGLPDAPVAEAARDVAEKEVAKKTPPRESRAADGQRQSPPARAPRPGGEAQLLERAQAALVRRPAEALRLTREHETRFPRGALVQEREVIAIDALERLGRVGAAKARAAAFEHRFHGSVHHPRVRRTTDTSAPSGGGSSTLPQ